MIFTIVLYSSVWVSFFLAEDNGELQDLQNMATAQSWISRKLAGILNTFGMPMVIFKEIGNGFKKRVKLKKQASGKTLALETVDVFFFLTLSVVCSAIEFFWRCSWFLQDFQLVKRC